MAILADIGRSNIGNTLGETLNYLQRERQLARQDKLLESHEKESALRMKGMETDQNIKNVQLEDAKRLRQKVGVDQLKSAVPFGYNVFRRQLKMMGLEDSEGFTTVGGLQEFGKYMTDPKNREWVGKVMFQDAQKQLQDLTKMETAEDGKELMKAKGINPKDIPAMKMKLNQAINQIKTTNDDFDEQLKITEKLDSGFRTFLMQKGVIPGRVDAVTMAQKIQELAPEYQDQVIAEEKRKQQNQIQLEREKAGFATSEAALTRRALSGDKEGQAILDAMQKRKLDIAKASAQFKSEGIDFDALAESVANGQDAPAAIKGSMGNPVATKVKSKVLEKYPKFSSMMADANYKWKQSATNQRTINFVGGALPRLQALDEQLKQLPNVDLNAINRVMRVVSIETGKPEYTNYESNRNAIVQEVNTALSGSSTGSDLRITIELENLKSARSPKQIAGAISNLREALIARMDVDLSPLYPIEVVRGEVSLDDYKKELYKTYRGKYPTNSEKPTTNPLDKYLR